LYTSIEPSFPLLVGKWWIVGGVEERKRVGVTNRHKHQNRERVTSYHTQYREYVQNILLSVMGRNNESKGTRNTHKQTYNINNKDPALENTHQAELTTIPSEYSSMRRNKIII
jgi:hypothetical protein